MRVRNFDRILLVPDFGSDPEAGLFPLIKKELDKKKGYLVMVADLKEMVRIQNPDEKFTDQQLIDRAAKTLEELISHDLAWGRKPSLLKSVLLKTVSKEVKIGSKGLRFTVEIKRLDPEPDELPQHNLDSEEFSRHDLAQWMEENELPDPTELDDWNVFKDDLAMDYLGKPDAVVLFGKSAMFSGSVGPIETLFINPVYSDKYPWTKQFYKDREAAQEWYDDAIRARTPYEVVSYFGRETDGTRSYPVRIGLQTFGERIEGFGKRYPGCTLIDPTLHDNPEKIADAIAQFTDGDLIKVLLKQQEENQLGTPGAAKQRVLIVPDFLYQHTKSDEIAELRQQLIDAGCYVAVFHSFIPMFDNSDNLVEARNGLRRRCKTKPFDLIIAFGTGCLFTGRVINCPRIFLNPDWDVWKEMQERLVENAPKKEPGEENEVRMGNRRVTAKMIRSARQLSEKQEIRPGDKPIIAIYSPDEEKRLRQPQFDRFPATEPITLSPFSLNLVTEIIQKLL